jgi:L-fuculose-phosphate aldolase
VSSSGSMDFADATKVVSEHFERIGKRMFAEGLVGANFGNMSARLREGFCITRSGSYLDAPGESIFVPLDGAVPDHASSEYPIHRKIYKETPYKAVIHAHPPYAIARSMSEESIEPIDYEGIMFTPHIPVVEGACGSDGLADRVAEMLKDSKVVIVRGHGTFAAGKNLDEAYIHTSLVEHSCRILILTKAQRG